MTHSMSSPTPLHRSHLRVVAIGEEPPMYDPPERTRPEPFAMMSAAVFDKLAGDGDAIAVFMAIAKHANKDGECWPSIATLCALTGYSDKHVRAKINRLVELGIIAKEPRVTGGMKSVNVYRICQKSPENQIGMEYRTSGTTNRTDRYGVPDSSVPGTDRTKTNELNPEELDRGTPHPSPKRPSPEYADDFESRFWAIYPKNGRGSKKKAAEIWKRLSPEDRDAAVAAIPVFAAGRDWQRGFSPGANVWLGDRRWENPPPPYVNGHAAEQPGDRFAAVYDRLNGKVPEPENVFDITPYQNGGER